MSEWAALINAIGSLLWPVVFGGSIFTFRREIRGVLSRIRRGKFPGGLEVELDKLDVVATEAARVSSPTATPTLPTRSDAPPVLLPPPGKPESEKQLLQEAVQAPKVALITLSIEIERELRNLLMMTGWHGGKDLLLPVPRAIKLLPKKETGLSPKVEEAVREFWDVRNRIIHGRSASDDDILRVLDSGLLILMTIRNIPHEVNVVHHPGAEVYADAEGKVPRSDVRALVLETTRTDGSKEFRVFPTTRTDYQKGKRVAWEWNSDRIWDESWYRDPDDGQIKYAWSGAVEFVGRHID